MVTPWATRLFARPSRSTLSTVRGVRCQASQILVTTGSQQALQICAHVLLDQEDSVAVEDPGYPGARQAFLASGAQLIGVPVDDEGMQVDELIRRRESVRAVYITPSHQYPLGRDDECHPTHATAQLGCAKRYLDH